MKTADLSAMPESRKLLIFVLMALGQFMALLDIQIVASSVAEISAGLGAAPDEASWIQTAYLMAEIVMIPLSGVLSRALSTRWLFTLSAAGFTLTSLGCGLATNIGTMIVMRAIQGFLGGAMIPTVFATGFALFRGPRQAIISAVLGMSGALAPTIGPTLGGWITETWSWHWLFFVNIVPGVIITGTIPFLARVDEANPSLIRKFDLAGLGLMAVSLASLEYVLEEGYRWGWFDDPDIRALAVLCLVSGGLFVWRSLRHAHPVVDFRALRDRTFAIATLFIFITGFGLFGAVYVLPLFLARIAGFNALQIGQAVFSAGLAMVLAAPFVSRLSRRADPRLLIAAGLGLFAFSLWKMTPLTSAWTGRELFWPQFLRGSAMLLCIVPATSMALGSVPPERLKMASALFNTLRNLGGAVGIACVNTWLNSRTNLHWLRLNENLQTGSAGVGDWLAQVGGDLQMAAADPALAGERALGMLARLVRREAVTLAFADVLWLMACLFAFALLLVPLIRRPPAPAKAPGEVH
ncbi:drug resistance transporter, EmrB/QacA subfamily [Opitutaceae bacterium TAV1]|nr:drug resistance transporter, EmrB/QacA subfamily [Opitutaceae bacterium TAV1]